MAVKRVPSTVIIDEPVKVEFKVEITRNGDTISDVVQSLMEGYIKVSKQLREDEQREKESRGQ